MKTLFKTKLQERAINACGLTTETGQEVSYTNHNKATIDWYLKLDLQEFGVYAMEIVVEQIDFSCTAIMEDDSEEFIHIITNPTEWKIIIEGGWLSDKQLIPTFMEIDYQDKQIEINYDN